MANDGQIVFEVTADGKHAIADIKEITRAIQQETGKWDAAAKESADGIENKFSGMLKKLAAGFSAVKIGKALLDLGQDAVRAASDLQEVQNVVDVTFGENANQIEKWAKNAGSQFGLTETQAKKFSSTMGAMLKSSGLAGEQIVGVSTDLAGLAADMASFYNLDFEEAFSKIRSGISGQTMPLKELGIDMSVATLNAFALKQGLDKTFNEMSQGEQTMLRYQYLMQATADAQGDFARTSDGYANSMRQLETNIESLKTSLGTYLIPVVNEAVGFINDLLLSLQSTGTRTVLDDFADIDLKTEQKLEQIRQTADEARILTDELDKIGGTKSNAAGSKVQQLVDDLSKVNLDEGKASAVKSFVSTLASNIGTLADIQGTDADGAKAWLDGIADSANKLDENDAEEWVKLIDEIRQGLPGIENTDFGSAFLTTLGGDFGDVSDKASTLSWIVTLLGDKTNKTADEQRLWLETCKRLVQTIPGLSSIINTETGEIKGGTDAVKEYIKAWEDGQTKLAMMNALNEKESALSSRFSDLPGLQLDMAVAKRRLNNYRDEINKLFKENGKQTDFGTLLGGTFFTEDFSVSPLANSLKKTDPVLYDILQKMSELKKAEIEAETAYQTQADAMKEAEVALEEYRNTVNEMPGETEQALSESEQYWVDHAEEIQNATTAAAEAIKALDEYVTQLRDNVATTVNNTVKGFEKIETPMDKNAKTTKDLTDKIDALDKKSKTYAKDKAKLEQELLKTQGEQTSAQSMKLALKQQAEYMDTYLANLRKARELGVSNDVLAQLSDGSTESADYLAALAEASPAEVEAINASYQAVIDKKKEMTDELTQQQLTVDSTYQSLAEKAKEAVAELDKEELAKENAGKTIQGVATGIAEHIPEVQEAVDGIIEQLNRLDGYGINLDFGGFGSISFTTSAGQKAEGSGRFGIPLVPHDDYIARLHEGERVLTAQENQMWNALMNGGVSGFDLESLGGVMRDNIKPGGNVYLDGKVVGSVISDRQGRSYKSLSRSGWQK